MLSASRSVSSRLPWLSLVRTCSWTSRTTASQSTKATRPQRLERDDVRDDAVNHGEGANRHGFVVGQRDLSRDEVVGDVDADVELPDLAPAKLPDLLAEGMRVVVLEEQVEGAVQRAE